MLPQDWGSKKNGGHGGLAVILLSKEFGLPWPSTYAGKRIGVNDICYERQRSSSGADLDAAAREF